MTQRCSDRPTDRHQHYWLFSSLTARGKKPSRNRPVLDLMLMHLLPLGIWETRQWLGFVESFRILLVFLRQQLMYKSRRFGSWTPVMSVLYYAKQSGAGHVRAVEFSVRVRKHVTASF
ncbi:hypothetical protein AOLI_G00254340 [Acnodon oligacanthus]